MNDTIKTMRSILIAKKIERKRKNIDWVLHNQVNEALQNHPELRKFILVKERTEDSLIEMAVMLHFIGDQLLDEVNDNRINN